eukprot:scaffold11984_cov94-Amphora_coffeaeformis.AAC.1
MRVSYAINRLENGENGRKQFCAGDNEIHIDEKWFFITELQLRTYLTQREKERGDTPSRYCKHKNHIIKVMFVTAVARPRFDENGECTFDGKIGIYPLVEQRRTQRRSINRPAGVLETQPITLSGSVYKDIVFKRIIPDAIRKWPRDRSVRTQTIGLQQDNPNTHFKSNDPEWIE